MPKSLLRVDDRPILECLLDQLGWPGPCWLVTSPGREHPPGWKQFDAELIDPIVDQGPLRGLLTALQALQAESLVAITVDMPCIRRPQLCLLLRELMSNSQSMGIMFARSGQWRQIVEPLPIALRKEAMEPIRQMLGRGMRSVRGLLEDRRFVAVAAPPDWDASLWTNLHAPSDLKQFTSSLHVNGPR